MLPTMRAGRGHRSGGRLQWMGRHRRSIVAVVTGAVTALVLVVGAPGRHVRSTGPPAEVERALTDVLRARAPGLVAAVRDYDGASWTEAKGDAVLGNYAERTMPRVPVLDAASVPMQPGDQFRVASITKTFVATLALQLVGQGRLDLDAPIDRYLPGLLHDGARIDVRQLLNNTSGLPDAIGTPTVQAAAAAGSAVSPTKWLQIADDLPRRQPPGAKYAYSNTNYVALGLLLERVTGQPLGRLLDDRLLRPLQLTATSYQPDPTTWPGARPDVAHGYLPSDFGPGRADVPIDDSGGVNGGAGAAAGVVSTTADLTRFYAALLSGRLLDRRLMAQMTNAVPQPRNYLHLPIEEDGYGLGLARYRLHCGIVWGQGGNLGQYYGIVLAAPDGRRTVAVLVNGATGKRSDNLFTVITAMLRAAELAYCRRS